MKQPAFPSAFRILPCALILLACASIAPADSHSGDPDSGDAERILRDAGIDIDGPAVLAYIRTHTLTDEELQRVSRTVKALGASEFGEREAAGRALVKIGPPALPFLRRALRDPDLEVSRRARACIEEIRLSPLPFRLTAAAQLLKDRRPAGSAAALLAYLPCIEDDMVEESWFDALRGVAETDARPDPAILAALTDKQSSRRAAAAHVLSRSSSADFRRRVEPLLADSDARVRFEAAAGLARAGDKTSIPVLMPLLTDAPLSVACSADHVLSLLADGKGPTLDGGKETIRRRCRDEWETWWAAHGDGADMSRLRRNEPPRGRMVVCEYDGSGRYGRIWSWGPGGQTRWEIARLEGPNDVQILPGGRVLVAERTANRVTERDRQGKILWLHRAAGNPIACQRLPNGNTLVTTFRELYEVTPEQTKVRIHRDRRDFRHALQLPNGHILYVTRNGIIVELDESWNREVRAIRPEDHAGGATFWASIEPLTNGRYLLAIGGSGRVIEVDAAGKVRWECEAPSPVFATRLRNGHTLISSFDDKDKCVIEVDRDGKEVAKQTLRGRPFVVRRY